MVVYTKHTHTHRLTNVTVTHGSKKPTCNRNQLTLLSIELTAIFNCDGKFFIIFTAQTISLLGTFSSINLTASSVAVVVKVDRTALCV